MNLITILKNAIYLLFGNFLSRIISAISTIFYAKFVGPKEYGSLSVAIALSLIAIFLTDLGLTNTFLREATKEKADLRKLISSYFKVRLSLSMIVAISSFFVFNAIYEKNILNIVIWIVYPSIFGAALQGVGTAYFQAIEKMQYSSIIIFFQGVFNCLAIILGIYYKLPINQVAMLYGLSSLLTGVLSIVLVLKHTPILNGWDSKILNKLYPFSINGIVITMIPQMGPIILEKVSVLSSVGIFTTAYKIPSMLYQVPGVIATAFYPRLFVYGNNRDYRNHRKLTAYEIKFMSFIGVLLSLPFILDPRFWIVSLLGNKWAESSTALNILSFLLILQSMNYPLADYLTTKGQQMKRTIIMLIGLLVAVITYILLGYSLGYIGASVAAILTELSMMLCYCMVIEKGWQLLLSSIKINIISLFVCLILYNYLPDIKPLFKITIIILLFSLLVILLDKVIRNAIRVKLFWKI